MNPSAPTILWPQVRVPSTTYLMLNLLLECEKNTSKQKRGMKWPVLSKIVFTKLFQANFCCTMFFPTKTFKATMSEIFSFKCFVFQFFEKIFFIFQQKRIQWGPNCEWIFHLLSLLF